LDRLVYSILDQENIARGHLAYHLKWTNEALKGAGDAYVAAGKATTDLLPAAAQTRHETALDALADARAKIAVDFVETTFAAQKAWCAAAGYRGLAHGLPPGTTEAQHGTKVVGAGACPSATG
jgi:hypothetical protein